MYAAVYGYFFVIFGVHRADEAIFNALKMYKLVVFASGSGTNAENLIRYFHGTRLANIELVLSNNSEAFVHQRAKQLGVPSITFGKNEFYDRNGVLKTLQSIGPDLIILAGFLWLVPASIIQAFEGRILNIHPALLPKFGGKGMYGSKVHQSVITAGETESGITIHLVNQEYDQGNILFQANCPVNPDDTPETLADRIHQLEYKHFPQVVERYLQSLNKLS